MKNRTLVVLFSIFMFQSARGQIFFEGSWRSHGIQYTGLLIFYDDNDAVMRVKFDLNNQHQVAEYKCYGEQLNHDDFKGYLLDGREATIVYGNKKQTYSADNFLFVPKGDEWGMPVVVDDATIEKDDPNGEIILADEWKRISTDVFTENYLYSFFDKNEPTYQTLLAYNLQYDQDDTEGYKISSLANGSGIWSVMMSQGTGFAKQLWKMNESFPADWVKERWNESFHVTGLAYGDDEWAVVMSKKSGYSGQAWSLNSLFQKDWITKKWSENYYITDLAYGNGKWGVIASKGTPYTNQEYKISSTFPADWVREKWKLNWQITSTAYGDGMWVIVMSKGGSFKGQTWKLNDTYPSDWIKTQWDKGLDVTSMAKGDGKWLAVMNQGTGYTTQAWKTNDYYPKDWISEKWNYQKPVVQDEPEVVETAKMHLILVTNTMIPDIGKSCQVDEDKTLKELEIICDELEIPLEKTVIHDKDFSKQKVTDALNALNPNPNDIVIFIYSGHGFRWSKQKSEYPNIDLKYSAYQKISEETCYNLSSIYDKIVPKGARLNIILGDCCNSDIGITSRSGSASLSSKHQTEGKLERLKQLFLQSKGNIIAAAAQPLETACGDSQDGGYFLTSFFSALSKETSQLFTQTPTWDSVIQRTIKNAKYKTEHLKGCSQQNGIYKSTAK